jgi:uncharacterized protein with NAD-binding domain and iron-sulfur cluster
LTLLSQLTQTTRQDNYIRICPHTDCVPSLLSSLFVQALLNFDAAMEDVRALDNISFSEWFEGKGGSRGSIKRMWDPIAYALVRVFPP